MVLEQVNFLAALEAGDSLDMNAALKYLQTHAGDGPHVALWSSVIAGDFPNADAILHNELLNPDRRGAFLIRVQRYADAPMTPQQQQWAAAWQAWVTRPQVQAEVSKWGRIDRYPVEDPN
jgi:hypothetical protein